MFERLLTCTFTGLNLLLACIPVAVSIEPTVIWLDAKFKTVGITFYMGKEHYKYSGHHNIRL